MESGLYIVLIASLITLADGVTITTSPEILQIDPTDTGVFTLPCTMEYSSFTEYGGNIPKWWKIQGEEQTLLSISDELTDEFSNTGRFLVTLMAESHELVELPLTVNNVQSADTGFYRCGTQTTYIEHEVSILEPVQQLTIRGGFNAGNSSTWTAAPLIYHYVESQGSSPSGYGYFQCVAEGGLPAATLQVSLIGDDYQLTGHLENGENQTFTGTDMGLQTPTSLSWITSNDFVLRKEDNGKDLECRATITLGSGTFHTVTETARVAVYYQPEIDCDAAYQMPFNAENVQIICTVTARPLPTDVTFYAVLTQAEISVGDPVHPDHNAQATMVDLQNDQVRVTITFIKVQQVHFQDYVLRARNVVDLSERDFTVSEGEVVVSDPYNSQAAIVPTLSLLLISVISQLL